MIIAFAGDPRDFFWYFDYSQFFPSFFTDQHASPHSISSLNRLLLPLPDDWYLPHDQVAEVTPGEAAGVAREVVVLDLAYAKRENKDML